MEDTKKTIGIGIICILVIVFIGTVKKSSWHDTMIPEDKPPQYDPRCDEALDMLKTGNKRFVEGTSQHPHTDAAPYQTGGDGRPG